MRYYEDLIVGEAHESAALVVDKAQMLAFAREYDPQYFHADEEAARASIFGQVVASGIYTMALWRRLDHQLSRDIAWICGVAWDEVRFPCAVRAGDTLRARAECLERRESRSDPRRGVVRYRYQLFNQRADLVFSCISTNLVHRRPAQG